MAQFELSFEKSKEVEKAMSLVSGRSEVVVNEVLKSHGSKEVIQAIIGFMPVSNRKKVHAKYSNPLRTDYFNLGFRVYAKGGEANQPGSYGYLVFPDDGVGRKNPVAQRFFKRGGEKATDKVLSLVLDALTKAFED